MKIFLKTIPYTILTLLLISCSKNKNINLELPANSGVVTLSIDGEIIDLKNGKVISNFNIGNPPGFIITAVANQNITPIPYLQIFISDITAEDMKVGAEFIGSDALEMKYYLYKEDSETSQSEYSAYTEEDVYLKITEVDVENKTITGTYNFIGLDGLDGWYEGGKTYEMEGSFENISFAK